MKRIAMLVVVMLAACGGEDGGGSGTAAGEAYCCDGTYEECAAAAADDELCFGGDFRCSDDRPLCIRRGTGPVCTHNTPSEVESRTLRACHDSPGSCPRDCVVVSTIEPEGEGVRYLSAECVSPDAAAGCF